MAKRIVSDELWMQIAPLLPAEPPKPQGGRPRLADRAALTGIIFVLKTGIPCGVSVVIRAAGPANCMATRLMTRGPIARRCDGVRSSRAWPAARWRAARGWGGNAGRPNGR